MGAPAVVARSEHAPLSDNTVAMREDLASLLKARRGHFELESGHHGDLWLDLESLCRTPSTVCPLAAELAQRLSPYRAEIVCGPLVEGAFVGLLVAAEMDVEFVYAEPRRNPGSQGLFPVSYHLPTGLRNLAGRRVAIVNDVINAGSAIRGTLADLTQCAAEVVAIGTLLALGATPAKLAEEASVPLETLAQELNTIWSPDACPLCKSGVPLVPHSGA